MGSAFSTACLGAGGAAADLPFSGADETLGHSFCYLSNAGDRSFRFRSISGASVSANSATPPTVGLPPDLHRPFESTALFCVVPLLPAAAASGPLDRSAAAGLFLSGPIERGALSGPLDSSSSSTVPFSAPLAPGPRPRRRRSFFRSFSVVPIRTFAAAGRKDHHHHRRSPAEFGENVQWAHGKAGEDRVQVVVSDDHRWLFVGIYDGFNGPDAPEFLMGNLYRSVFAELQGLLWVDQSEPSTSSSQPHHSPPQSSHLSADNGDDSAKRVTFSSNRAASGRGKTLWELLAEEAAEEEEDEGQGIDLSGSKRFAFSINCIHIPTKRRTPSFPNFRLVSSRSSDRVPLEDGKERLGQNFRKYKAGPVDHDAVLRALARGLAATEAAYLEMTDEFMDRNPELALMGSCLLVVLMKDEDVYVMNVGDSRAIVAQYHPHEMDSSCDAEGIVETMDCGDQAVVGLAALQLSTDHSTSIEEVCLHHLGNYYD